MKAITLRQPWASLVACGAKRIKTRSWLTHHRGPLAIHAAVTLTGRDLAAALREPFRSTLAQAGILASEQPKPAEIKAALPRGVILAVVDLIECVRMTDHTQEYVLDSGKRWQVPPTEPERSFGQYDAGRYAWLLCNVRLLPEPVAANGMLGLWTVPDDLIPE